MSLPFIFPNDNSSGRLTEICSFRKSGISSSEFDEIFAGITKTVADFPISRQNIVGSQMEDPEICVLIADWTSAAEKDVFEPGEQYQSVKPAFGKLVHATSPDFAW
ncbi:hypothetical protein GQ53DRAFT_767958 [Thozetella sp. PMI_491]|nr:hypothetical protein GQ53DRAFT_767958 [Thozetella sp. PMI_491]